eukprot:TRINITY_DN37307_c0_g1_i1.p1 TRINITY_DN37307_c0_g1~~TRINITY_DN37307_c0_g1_i1.p1  ORF type:complete len:152 (+),score=30.14 TRINITY_DN37307_c0_g1_i1:29-484(+)
MKRTRREEESSPAKAPDKRKETASDDKKEETSDDRQEESKRPRKLGALPRGLETEIQEFEHKLRTNLELARSRPQHATTEEQNEIWKSLATMAYIFSTGKDSSEGSSEIASDWLYQLAMKLKTEGFNVKVLRKIFTYLNRYYVKHRKLTPI